MSFRFNWNFFNVDELYRLTKKSMTESIAQAKRSPMLVEPLKVVDIDFGTEPPELSFHSIPYVSEKRTHIVFKLKYEGDAYIKLQTVIQLNPLIEVFKSSQWPSFLRPAVLGATNSLAAPFQIRIHHLVLESLVDVVYAAEGLTVSFRDRPIRSVETSSSLDEVPGVQKLITSALSEALAESFYEDIPEGIWKSTSKNKTFPDPTRGPRRWSQFRVVKTRYFDVSKRPDHAFTPIAPFDTLALSASVPHAILSRTPPVPSYNQAILDSRESEDTLLEKIQSNIREKGPLPDLVDFGTDISIAASGSSTPTRIAGGRPLTPLDRSGKRRRKISLKKLIPKSSSVESSPSDDRATTISASPLYSPEASPSNTFISEFDNSLHPPVKLPYYDDPVVHLRRYSSPSWNRSHKKIRTASLQPLRKPEFLPDPLDR